MNRKTRKALLKSIFIKWENILSCKGKESGNEDCPLCKLFFANGCEGCPIAEKTRVVDCEMTPYEEWIDRAPHDDMNNLWLGASPDITVIYLAVKEQEFLISLLSKKDQRNLEFLYKTMLPVLAKENN